MTCEKNTLEIFLNVSFLKPTTSTDPVENWKSFMSCSELFYTIKKVFDKDLSNFAASSPDDEPIKQELLKWMKLLSQSDVVKIIEHFVNSHYV